MAAKEANIKIICLPPHTSGALQPLDVSVFKSVKHVWRQILKEFFWESKHTAVKKEHFPLLLNDLYKHMVKHGGHLTNGFSKSGLCPLDRTSVPKQKIMLSETLLADSSLDTSSCSIIDRVMDSSVQSPQPATSGNVDCISETAEIGSPACTSSPNVQAQSSSAAQRSPMTPKSALRKAIVETLRPNPSTRTKNALKQGRAKRKRIQKEAGECMTEDLCIQRLKHEEEERDKKKAQIKKTQSKKAEADKKSAKVTVRRKKQTKRKTGKEPKRKTMIIESSSDEDQELENENEDDDAEPGLVETEELSEENVVELTLGNYYIIKVEDEPIQLFTIGKLISIRDDDYVVVQFYKSEPLTNKLTFRCWGGPESTALERVHKNIAKPSSFGKGGKLVYTENDLPNGMNLK